jgi:hypothetical protein
VTVTKTVLAVRTVGSGAWMVDYDDASAHGFPPETLSWRAAEYGIDPNDVDTLLEIVLHEPHVNLHHTDPTFLYNTDEETARAAHLRRVAASPVRVQDSNGHLEQIRMAHRSSFDPAQHSERCRQVAAIRAGRGTAPHIRLSSGVR